MRDLGLAVRTLRSTPVVSVVAILSLALGIGANTAIFSLVNALLLRSLPVRQPDRLVFLQNGDSDAWTYPQWAELRTRAGIVADAAAWSTSRFNIARSGETQFVNGILAGGRFFDTLGVEPILGRVFDDADDVRGGGRSGPVAVISYAFWQRQYGGAADAVGRVLTIDRVPLTIVGVTPSAFFGVDIGQQFDVAMPLGVEPLLRGKDSNFERRSSWWLRVIARVKDGQSIDSALAALRAIQPQIREATIPPNWTAEDQKTYLIKPFTATAAAGGASFLRTRFERPLLTILVVVALVLLIACANIANLQLARATARRHELSVRLALGASRWRLARHLLAESAVLSASGALVGLLFAQWASQFLVRQLSTPSNTVFLELSPDWRVLLFTIGISVITALLFGTAPALRAARIAPMDAMKERGSAAAGGGLGRRLNLANGLVVAQVALSLMLVVAAGMFVRTFAALATVRLGFEADRVLVVNVNLQRSRVDPLERIDLVERARQAVLAAPGVARAAVSATTPVSGNTWNNTIEVVGAAAPVDRSRRVTFVNYVSPDFFSTFGTPMLAGRDVSPADGPSAPRVAVVNEAFVKQFVGAGDPIGRIIRQTGGVENPEWQIVGVAADAIYQRLRETMRPTMYIPIAQYAEARTYMFPSLSIGVRPASGSPAGLTRTVGTAIVGVDRDLALTFRPLAAQIDASLAQERIVAMLSGFFGALALLLAALGLYGVTSYAVSRRRTEIGIRMALGAAPGGVIRLVLRRVSLLVLAGVAIGAGASIWLSKFVETLLFGLQPRDPATLIGASLLLAFVGALAGWLPAHRASRIDPAEVLRDS